LSSFFVGVVQVSRDQGDGFFFGDFQDGDEAFADDVGLFVAGVDFYAQDQGGFGAFGVGQGAGGHDAGLHFAVHDEVGQFGHCVAIADLDEAEGAVAAEFGGGVDGAAVSGFELDVVDAGEEEGVGADAEGVEAFGDGGFCEAAFVGFGGVAEETMEGGFESFGEIL